MDYEFLKRYMKEKRITRAQLAKDLGVSIYTINNWFGRKPKNFPFDMALKISMLYQIPIEKLYSNVVEKAVGIYDVRNGSHALRYTPETHSFYDEQGNLLATTAVLSSEQLLVERWSQLNMDGQNLALEYLDMLTRNPKYTEEGDL